jgi:catechol 2,3-dioxygenase-like lactoylglutathione lyase family enzyme
MTAPRLVLDQLNLVVRDMEASIAFYRRLGLEIPDRSIWRTGSGPHHVDVQMPSGVHLELDSVAMAKKYNAGWEPTSSGSRNVIGFSLPSREAVDKRYAELTAAGYRGRQEPYDAFWGARYAIVEDPDGNHVGLMSPMDPARRSAPPDI